MINAVYWRQSSKFIDAFATKKGPNKFTANALRLIEVFSICFELSSDDMRIPNINRTLINCSNMGEARDWRCAVWTMQTTRLLWSSLNMDSRRWNACFVTLLLKLSSSTERISSQPTENAAKYSRSQIHFHLWWYYDLFVCFIHFRLVCRLIAPKNYLDADQNSSRSWRKKMNSENYHTHVIGQYTAWRVPHLVQNRPAKSEMYFSAENAARRINPSNLQSEMKNHFYIETMMISRRKRRINNDTKLSAKRRWAAHFSDEQKTILRRIFCNAVAIFITTPWLLLPFLLGLFLWCTMCVSVLIKGHDAGIAFAWYLR